MLVSRSEGSNATVCYASAPQWQKVEHVSITQDIRKIRPLTEKISFLPFYFRCCSFRLTSVIYTLAGDALECRCPPLQIQEMWPCIRFVLNIFAVLILNYTRSSGGECVLCLPPFHRHLSGSAFSASLFISTTCSDVPSIKVHYAAECRIASPSVRTTVLFRT